MRYRASPCTSTGAYFYISNMKFAMNGSLVIGTLDGANVEILQEIGEENIFIFGAKCAEVNGIREQRRNGTLGVDPRFNQVLGTYNFRSTAISLTRKPTLRTCTLTPYSHMCGWSGMIEIGTFGTPDKWGNILNSLQPENDFYLVGHDFADYLDAQVGLSHAPLCRERHECPHPGPCVQERVAAAYKDKLGWAKKTLLSTARSAFFSSDRTIKQYAEEIWNVKVILLM